MAKFGPVAPPAVLWALKRAGVLGDYHLLLAHDVAERQAKYYGLFTPDDIIIMDNSVIELGHPVSASVMLEALKVVKSKYVVLPDVIGDMERTLESTMGCYGEWQLAGMSNFMAVPQGATYEEWKRCAFKMAQLPDVAIWGVPRRVCQALGSREEAVQILNGISNRPIHLLGFSDNLEDDIKCAKMQNVLGIDSTVPIRLGLLGIEITPHLESHPPRGSWFETATEINDLVVKNLQAVRSWIA